MSGVVEWWYSGNFKSFTPEEQGFLKQVTGAYWAGSVKRTEVSRTDIYQSSLENRDAYQELFRQLKPGTLWLHNHQGEEVAESLKRKITANGGREEIDFALLFAEAPDKIFAVYRAADQGFLLERFVPTALSGLAQPIKADEVKQRVIRHVKSAQDLSYWTGPAQATGKKIAELRERLIKDERALEEMRPGKKTRHKRQELKESVQQLKNKLQQQDQQYAVWRKSYELSVAAERVLNAVKSDVKQKRREEYCALFDR